MNDTEQRERARSLLGNLASWINHSDDYQNHFFDFDEDITEQSALDLVVWIEQQIDRAEQIADMWKIVQAVATEKVTYRNDSDSSAQCPYCLAFQTQREWLIEKQPFSHEQDCIVTKARAMVSTENNEQDREE